MIKRLDWYVWGGVPGAGGITYVPVGSSTKDAAGLDRPVGMARLPDGRYVVAETDRSRLRVLTPGKA